MVSLFFFFFFHYVFSPVSLHVFFNFKIKKKRGGFTPVLHVTTPFCIPQYIEMLIIMSSQYAKSWKFFVLKPIPKSFWYICLFVRMDFIDLHGNLIHLPAFFAHVRLSFIYTFCLLFYIYLCLTNLLSFILDTVSNF